MATHSSIFAWRIPWTEEPGGLYSPWGHKELDRTEQLTFSSFFLATLASVLILDAHEILIFSEKLERFCSKIQELLFSGHLMLVGS